MDDWGSISVSDFFEATKPEAPPMPNQLYSLRLDPDLKDICRCTHMRLSGRKTEVLARIERGWDIDSPGVRDAVRRAINPRSFSSGSYSSSSSGGSSGGSSFWSSTSYGGASCSSSSSSSIGGHGFKITVPLPSSGGVSNVRCVCNSRHMLPTMVTCCECGALMHPTCVHVPYQEASTPSFACASCKATWLDPFLPMIVDREQSDRLGCRTDGAALVASLNPLLAAFRQQFYVPGANQMQLSNVGQPNVTHMDLELSSARLHDLLLGKKLEVPSHATQPCAWPGQHGLDPLYAQTRACLARVCLARVCPIPRASLACANAKHALPRLWPLPPSPPASPPTLPPTSRPSSPATSPPSHLASHLAPCPLISDARLPRQPLQRQAQPPLAAPLLSEHQRHPRLRPRPMRAGKGG